MMFSSADIDECERGIANCNINTMCINTPGGFTCGCLRGMIGDGVDCTDIDECDLPETNGCHEDALCVNTEGSYVCSCLPGFEGNGRVCAGKPARQPLCYILGRDGPYVCSCLPWVYR